MSTNEELISDRLRAAMQKRNLSAADLARLLRTTSSTVFGWLKGTKPRKRAMEDLEKLLEVPAGWLLHGGVYETANEVTVDHPDSISEVLDHPCGSVLREEASFGAHSNQVLEDIMPLLGYETTSALVDRMFEKAKADHAYFLRNGETIRRLVNYLKTPDPNAEP